MLKIDKPSAKKISKPNASLTLNSKGADYDNFFLTKYNSLISLLTIFKETVYAF